MRFFLLTLGYNLGKIRFMKLIIFALLLLPLAAFAQDNNIISYQPQAEESYATTNPDTNNEAVSAKADKENAPPQNIQIENLDASGVIKAGQSLCIKGDCRDHWPVLKCADFNGRPAGETGQDFCQKTNKTCAAVAIGSGASFFNECTTPPISTHKTRCCWVE